MAKRKRLTPAQTEYMSLNPGLETKSMQPGAALPGAAAVPPAPPPVAQVAGDAATQGALAELSGLVESARRDGRLLEAVPLEDVQADYLIRDRLVSDPDEMATLLASLRARGQQTAIEVVELPARAAGPRYGLISGWRRLTALRQLAAEDPVRFGTVAARIVAPESTQDAYVAMVEENEIRVGLSYYERAHVVVRAMEQDLFSRPRVALQTLFSAASRTRRSKIGAFVRVVEAFDGALRFPTALPERLGLALSKWIKVNEEAVARLRADLLARPPQSATEEADRLSAAMEGGATALADPVDTAPPVAPTSDSPPSPAPDSAPAVPGSGPAPDSQERDSLPPPPLSEPPAPGLVRRRLDGVEVHYEAEAGRIRLEGARITGALHDELVRWLRVRLSDARFRDAPEK